MARSKVTITLDRTMAEDARQLIGARSTSEVVDIALQRLVRAERLRRDIAAYRQLPPTREEVEMTLLEPTGDLDDDTDWQALYAESPP